MKRISAFLLIILCLAPCLSASAFAQGVYSEAESAVLYDVGTDTVLFSKDSEKRMPMASTTKIMTAIVALEWGDPNEIVTISRESVGVEGSSCYLKEGEQLSLRSLLYALLLQSANDAATAIALHIAGSIESFALLMNCKAAELGLANSHFENPHGLDSEGHYTTALDLARLADYCMENEDFQTIWSTVTVQIPLSENEKADHVRTLYNHNRLLRSYPPCIGGKTGYTMRCGRCLVSAAEQNGHRLVAVTLNCRHDWTDHVRLYEYGFSEFDTPKDVTSWKKYVYKNMFPTAG